MLWCVGALTLTKGAGADGYFEAGDLTTDNLAILYGVTSIRSTTFDLANFEWIA